MITAQSKEENYCAELSNGIAAILADATKDKGGRGKSFRPHDLLCAALASCLNIAVRMALDSRSLPYERVKVNVDLDRIREGQTKFLYGIEIVGDLPEETKRHIIELASSCPVKKTLSKEIVFEEMAGEG